MPQLRAFTINQGLGYGALARGKETLVRLFLSLPQCASSTSSIAVTGGTLTLKNGTTTLGTVQAPTPDLKSPFPQIAPFGSAPMVDSTGDPKFVVPGSVLAAGPTSRYTLTVIASLGYQSLVRSGATPVSGTQALTTVLGSNTPMTATVEQRTNALRILAVPMGKPVDGFSDVANGATQNGITALSRIFPVPAGVTRLTASPATGGIRWVLDGGMLDLSNVNGANLLNANGLFCGTGSNFDALKGKLAQFLQSWNTANPSFTADRVMGVVDNTKSLGLNNGCAEGMASVSSPESWARVTPDGASPSSTGSVMSMEVTHTFTGVPLNRDDDLNEYHSINVSADVPLTNRAYNVNQRAYLANNKTTMALLTDWNQANTLLETPDFAYLLCQLGGQPSSGCAVTGTTGTATGVGANPHFVVAGTTDGTPGGTTIVEPYFAATPTLGLDTSNPQPGDLKLKFVQKQGSRILQSDDFLARHPESDHDGSGSTSPSPTNNTINLSVPFNTSTTLVEIVNRATGAVLFARNRGSTPSVQGTTATAGCGASCLHAGALDPSFGTGGKVTTTLTGKPMDGNAVALQPDGKIVVAGIALIPRACGVEITCPDYDFAVARYDEDGSLDTTFGSGGIVLTDIAGGPSNDDYARAVATEDVGGETKIVVAGTSCVSPGDCDLALARYNANGTLDSGFGGDGIVDTSLNFDDELNAIAVDGDGKLVVAGSSFAGGDTNFLVARYNPNGTVDTSFASPNGYRTAHFSGAGLDDFARAAAVQPDGKIVVAGYGTPGVLGANNRMIVARYTDDGNLDTTSFGFCVPDGCTRSGFNLTTFGTGNGAHAYSLAIQPDGKIVLGGRAFIAVGPSTFKEASALARFTADGMVDTAFGTGGEVTVELGPNGTENGFSGLAIQPDGKIVAGGDALKEDIDGDNSDFAVARFESSGGLDSTFGDSNEGSIRTGWTTTELTGAGDNGRGLALQSDGKIVVAGGDSVNFLLARYLGQAQSPTTQVTATVTADTPANVRGELRLVCQLPGGGFVKHIVDVGVEGEPIDDATHALLTFASVPPIPCLNGKYEVFATDGFTSAPITAGAIADPPDAAEHDPVAAIANPLEDAHILESADVALRGTGNDIEDTILPDNRFHWVVSGGALLSSPLIFDGKSIVDFTLPASTTAYTATLTVTDFSDSGSTGSADVSFFVDADADHDGMGAAEETELLACYPGGSPPAGYKPDNDPFNAFADYDGDGIPNVDDPEPCTPATSYEANINFDPNTLYIPSTGNTVSVYVRLPYRDLKQIPNTPTAVQITKIEGKPTSIDNIGWSVTGSQGPNQVGLAKFDRQALITYLKSQSIMNEQIYLTVSGTATPGWSVSGIGTTFVAAAK